MFWRMAGLAQASPVESVLDRDDFTLQDLMEEEDLIQECKSLNGRLVALYVSRACCTKKAGGPECACVAPFPSPCGWTRRRARLRS